MSGRNRAMTVDYGDDLRLYRSRLGQAGLVALALLWLLTPLNLSDFQLNVLNYAGVFAIGAIGLNLLTGFTGQVSLGHAFFIAAGAYVASFAGVQHGLPLFVWLPLAAIVGGAIGAIIGPFALRLRGDYLAIITLGLVVIGDHVFNNWGSLTGGGSGTAANAPVSVGPVNFADLNLAGSVFTRDQGYFWLIWALVALVALLAKNLVRSRPGRAMQAVRDRDVAAEVIGVSLARYKIGAFAVSSALAATAGALYGSLQQFVSPTEWTLFLSIQFIAIIIVGGLGTVFGSVLGALVLGSLPRIVERFSDKIPGVSTGPGSSGFISVASLNLYIFGLLIVLFLVFQPRGIAAVWLRIKAYFRSWPFSY